MVGSLFARWFILLTIQKKKEKAAITGLDCFIRSSLLRFIPAGSDEDIEIKGAGKDDQLITIALSMKWQVFTEIVQHPSSSVGKEWRCFTLPQRDDIIVLTLFEYRPLGTGWRQLRPHANTARAGIDALTFLIELQHEQARRLDFQ